MNTFFSLVVIGGLLTGGFSNLPAASSSALLVLGPGQADAKSVSIGTVKIGQYEVEAFQEGSVTAGKEATFQLKLKGEGEPEAIRVWIGIESARGSSKGKAHKHGDVIEVHCDVPETIPEGAKLWIELEQGGSKTKGAVDYKKD